MTPSSGPLVGTIHHHLRLRLLDDSALSFFSFILAKWLATLSDREWSLWNSSANLFCGNSVMMTPSRKTYTNRLFKVWCWNISNIRLVPTRIVSVPIKCRKSSEINMNAPVILAYSLFHWIFLHSWSTLACHENCDRVYRQCWQTGRLHQLCYTTSVTQKNMWYYYIPETDPNILALHNTRVLILVWLSRCARGSARLPPGQKESLHNRNVWKLSSPSIKIFKTYRYVHEIVWFQLQIDEKQALK
jgi:hypothetical protein